MEAESVLWERKRKKTETEKRIREIEKEGKKVEGRTTREQQRKRRE